MIKPILISTNDQKLLGFFLLHPGQTLFEREVSRKAGISPSSTNRSLTRLYKTGLLNRKRNGKMCFYSIERSNPYLKEFKILNNLLLIEPLIEKLKKYTRKIVLFGSWANGEDTENSDIDLFIISSEEEKIRPIINKFSYSNRLGNRKVQAIIRRPEELLKKQDKPDEILLGQVEKGKVLWEKEINEDIL